VALSDYLAAASSSRLRAAKVMRTVVLEGYRQGLREVL
jgi:hypothetical protein